MSETQPASGFWNRASVVLFLVFTIPAALSIAGMLYVANQGRVPGGENSFCEISLTEDIDIRIDIYTYTAGLVEFEIQTAAISDNDKVWNELFSDTIPVPQTFDCDTALTRLDDNHVILQNQKSLAWSSDNGINWNIQNVCDDPRPSRGRCDNEVLNYSEAMLNPDGTGTLIIIESKVDEFGEPERDENDNPIVVNQWRLSTSNAGQTWVLNRSD